MKYFLGIFLLITSNVVWAQKTGPNLCDILDIKNCSGVSRQGRRTSLLSLPSPTTSSLMNPATVSFDRGFGVEAIFQPGNTTVLSAASGTGRVGGAIISTSLENSFFGNRVRELESDILTRYKTDHQYKNRKLALAFGGKLFRQKHFQMDAGVILKRHNELKQINPGAGVSGRLGFLHFGYSIYKDDYYLDFRRKVNPVNSTEYTTQYGREDYSEKITVSTYSIGTKYKNLSFDYGFFKSIYKDSTEWNSEIQIFASSYVYQNFMFNLAYRKEKSPAPVLKHGELDFTENKNSIFAGVQYSINKHFIVGLNYNYFLLDEISFSTSIFF